MKETNSRFVIAHNHPSGNVTPSVEDTRLTLFFKDKFGDDFAGHIILDHNTFNVYDNKTDEWDEKQVLQKKITLNDTDPLIDEEFAYNKYSAHNASELVQVAKKVNAEYAWADDFIPVVFANSENKITGVKLYDKDFFSKNHEEVHNELQFAGIEAGATYAFPVLTEHFVKGNLNTLEKYAEFSEKLKNLALNGAISDAVMPTVNSYATGGQTINERYHITPKKSFVEIDIQKLAEKTKRAATWDIGENPELYRDMFEKQPVSVMKVNELQNQAKRNQIRFELSDRR